MVEAKYNLNLASIFPGALSCHFVGLLSLSRAFLPFPPSSHCCPDAEPPHPAHRPRLRTFMPPAQPPEPPATGRTGTTWRFLVETGKLTALRWRTVTSTLPDKLARRRHFGWTANSLFYPEACMRTAPVEWPYPELTFMWAGTQTM